MAEYTFENWLADLRSGEYEQAKGKLCEIREDGSMAFCCLGLLEHKLGRLESGMDRETGNSEVPPSTVATLLGLPINRYTGPMDIGHFDPEVIIIGASSGEWQMPASVANDNGRTFAEIADGLELARKQGLY
jgi:hypothetical protein